MKKKISIIIRTKNEEKWITACLKAVFSQTYKDFEVIIVDNKSSDKTVEKAKAFDVKFVEIEDFLPGKAINMGIRKSIGDIIVLLSGHCIPVNDQWLENLIRDLEDERVAGVYGRQEPLSFSSDLDKRDLTIIFGLDKKIQTKDPFFHNANSAIKRSVWEKIPFDEKVTNIEDRLWGREMVFNGYTIVYEPEASVYHYHGIHQGGDEERCRNVVRILDSLNGNDNESNILNINDLNIVAVIPKIGEIQYCGETPLLNFTIEQALESDYIKRVIVSTDSEEVASVAVKMGAETPFIRPKELSEEYIGLNMVMQYSLEKMEDVGIFPDVIIIMEETYPFRPKGFIDHLIVKLIKGGFDSIVPGKIENKSVWIKTEKETKIFGQGLMPRNLRDQQLYVSLLGLGLCTYPHFIRDGKMLGDKVGIIEVSDFYSQFEVRSEESLKLIEPLLNRYNQLELNVK